MCGYSPFSSAGSCFMGPKVKVPKVGVRVELDDCLTARALMFSNAGGAPIDARDGKRNNRACRGDGPNVGFGLFVIIGVQRRLREGGEIVCAARGSAALKIEAPKRARGGARNIGGRRDTPTSDFTLFVIVGVRRFLWGCVSIVSPLKVGAETKPLTSNEIQYKI